MVFLDKNPFLSHFGRNYNPVERRTKGGRERFSKSLQKNSKSLQANNVCNISSTDTVGVTKASG